MTKKNFIQKYIEAPVPGRMLPQPNDSMWMTKFVKRLLRLK